MATTMLPCGAIIGLLACSLEGYRRFVAARSGAGPFAVYVVCESVSLWALATFVYFGVIHR